MAVFLLWLQRWRTARLPRNLDNNLPEDGYGDKPELEGSRGIARVTKKPELEANKIETRNISLAGTTATKLPAIPPDQNTSIYLGDKPELYSAYLPSLTRSSYHSYHSH